MIKEAMPILIYDNLCTSCTNYAKMVNSLVKEQIIMIGHYTSQGKQLKKNIFPEGYDGLEMSWFVTEKCAYGGRAGLIQLIRYILFSKKTRTIVPNQFDMELCTTDCKTVKGVFIRSCSIMSHSKKIVIRS
jgi:predicted DCC family thiol-disulfide oxidoreductase YuxK